MPTTGGGQIDARRRADLMRAEIVHEELRQERWGHDVPDEDPEDSLKQSSRPGSIYMLIGGIMLVALIIGLIWFVF